ncbi:MAG: hypothetical protein Q9212_002193 [Teloschistes hypoglaucus]
MSPSATEPSSLERHLSSAEEAQLAEALELRRKQIDREIAEFTADKENEFRKFEKRLRSEKRDPERQKILQCEKEVGKANQKRRRSSDHLPVHSHPQTNGRVSDGQISNGSHVDGTSFVEADEIPVEHEMHGSSPHRKRPERADNPQEQQSFHERELEFQGLFTPDYLPLLNGQSTDSPQDMNYSRTSEPGKKVSRSKLKKSSSDPATASTQQAPVSGSEPTGPATPRSLSSGDPRKLSMAERRSSSRSDTSVSSLRSSLRDPNQLRSPKRVLFSIDNVLVSPSTSPTLQRKVSAVKVTNTSDRSLNLAPQQQAVVVPKRDVNGSYKNLEQRPEIPSQPKKPTLTNIPTTNGRPNGPNGGPTLRHPAAQIWSTSPSIGGDDFEHIRGEEEDDLFAFDEEVRYRRNQTSDDEDVDDEIKEEELVNGNNELPTSSPHAGSLPIEINWPGRKDPKG